MTKPVAKIRDGRLTATIWKNEKLTEVPTSEIGHFYSVDIKRSYKDSGDQWQETASFSGAELLRVANLAQAAYNHILHLKSSE